MEYVYTAMLLHSAGAKVDAKSVEKVLKAAGIKADKSRAEALVASLEGVDIEEAMATAAVAAPAAGAENVALVAHVQYLVGLDHIGLAQRLHRVERAAALDQKDFAKVARCASG